MPLKPEASGSRPGTAPSEVVSIVIADDDPRVQNALVELLEDHPMFRVVGVADDGSTAADICGRELPLMAIVDVMMHDGGDVATRAIHDASPATTVVVYTAKSDRRTRERMLASGASTVLAKGAIPDLPAALLAARKEARNAATSTGERAGRSPWRSSEP